MQRDFRAVPVYARSALKPGNQIQGPAVIAEDETTTIITSGFTAALDQFGRHSSHGPQGRAAGGRTMSSRLPTIR